MNKIIKRRKRKMSSAFRKGNEFFTWYTQMYPDIDTTFKYSLMYCRGYVIFKL